METTNNRFHSLSKAIGNPQQKVKIKRRASRFVFYKGTLYRDGVFLQCVSNDEAKQVVKEVQFGICGAHQFGLELHY